MAGAYSGTDLGTQFGTFQVVRAFGLDKCGGSAMRSSEMLSRTGTIIVISMVIALGISAVVLSVVILRRGKLYDRLRPEARPRRWILISILFLFAVFVIWFPVWMTWPDALISRLLLGLFSVAFLAVGVTIKWLTPFVDSCFRRRGWPLR